LFSADASLPLGLAGHIARTFITGSCLRNAEDVGRLVFGNRGDYPLYLRDIATVEHVRQNTKQIVNHFTGPADAGEHRAAGSAPSIGRR
jgi:multidrug efflux pump subunit AcrB